jgi:hypothetical protein
MKMIKILSVGALAAGVVVIFSVADSPVHAQDNAAECTAEQGVTYLCGFVVPEDVVNLESTGLALAGGHRAPGHMYLIDPATGESSELIHTAAFSQQHDMNAYPGCPGPLNTQSFDVHGISVTPTAAREFTLYTTSHGEREAIEIYDLDLSGASPSLTWTGCVMLAQDGYHNAVIRLDDGGFVATRMRDSDVNNADVRPGQITGRLFEWHPGGRVQAIAGTDLSLPNGIDISPDQRYLYVAASGTNEIVRFDRSVTPIGKQSVSVPMRPDNIHWDGNGMLLSAGGTPPNGGWAAVEIDPDTLAVTVLGSVDGAASMQRASAATRVGDEIWVGSNEDRIARFPLN